MSINNVSTGISPVFAISSENFKKWYVQVVTRVDIDGVSPPSLGVSNGKSSAHDLMNQWFPWIDEKLVEPKFDGVCAKLGTISNRPTQVKDYHIIAMMRAVDAILAPRYVAFIVARVNALMAEPPPKG